MAKISVIGITGGSYFMSVDHFHENGETLSASSLFYEVGGKGMNQALAAARFGAQVSFLAAVGDDSDGKESYKCCTENGITPHLKVKSTPSPTAFILTDKSGENRVTVFRGAELSEEDVYAFEEEIRTSDILLLQNEVPESVNTCAVSLAKKYGVRVILNPAPARESSSLEGFLATPNEQESRFIDPSLFENTIVTLGKKGCLINGKTTVPATPDRPVDTTGAGDTFNGVLAVCIAEGMCLEDACRFANAASGISVTRAHVIDAIPTREEIERKLQDE